MKLTGKLVAKADAIIEYSNPQSYFTIAVSQREKLFVVSINNDSALSPGLFPLAVS